MNPTPLPPLAASMPTLLAVLLLLGGCGLETAGTAAAVGVTKKQELEQGQATANQLQDQLRQSTDLNRQRTEALEKAAR